VGPFAYGEADIKTTQGNAKGVFDQTMYEGREVCAFDGIVFVVISMRC